IDPHPGQTRGYPSFEHWPAADDIKHQQVGLRWLKDAHDNGLNIIVASVVNNQWLSAAAIASGRHNNRMSPSDMESIKRQIVSLHELDRATPWYTIVRDPWEARRAIEAGQLAVVLAVEASDIMPAGDGPWLEQLRDLYHMGVRTVQMAHESNSLFAGAAFHRDIFEINSRIKAWFDRDIDYASAGNGINNPSGLTSRGRQMLAEMIRLGMLIDIAHLSLVTQRQIYSEVATRHRYYPLYNSHTRIERMLTDEWRDVLKEHVTTDETLEFVRRTGGILGLRTGDEPMRTYDRSGRGATIGNNCDGSTRSFAQFYQYAADRGVNTAFGSDFNGFITQLGPRFGAKACPGALDAVRAQQRAAQGARPGGQPDYWQAFADEGLAHIGLLPGLLTDMRLVGADTSNIERSAEAFVSMWERVYDSNRQAVP
ncbi:MAG: membrane dipeptidase, partial [Myxococcota bacterium]